jgi:hypothetical protein
MKYLHTETGEIWDGSHPCTSHTSNFYLLSHEEKVALGWEQVAENEIIISDAEKQLHKLSEIKNIATRVIMDTYPTYKQINASLNIYGADFTVAMVAYIQSVRARVAEYEARITEGDIEFQADYSDL